MKLYFLLISGIWCAPALGWYAGGSVGLSDYADFDTGDIDDGSFTNSMGDPTPSSDDTNPLAVRLFAGLDLSKHFAIEGGYTNLGEAEVSAVSNSCCVWSAGKVTGSVEYSGLEGSVIARTDLGGWNLGGRVGLFAWDDAAEVRDSAGTYSGDDTGIDLAFGVVAARGMLRLDLSHYTVEQSVTALAVGVVFRP